MLWKCCTQYASKFGKLSSGHRTEKVSFHSNRKERQCQRMFKQCTTALISHTSKLVLKFCQARLQQYVNFQRYKLVVDKAEKPEIKLLTSVGSEKARELQKNIYFCNIDCAKAFDCVDHNKLENSERDGNTRPPDLPPEKSSLCFIQPGILRDVLCRSRRNS